VADAEGAAQEAQRHLTQAEARAESAEQAKIELSLKLADFVAQRDSAGDVSGMPSNQETESGAANNGDSLQKRYASLQTLKRHAMYIVEALSSLALMLCNVF